MKKTKSKMSLGKRIAICILVPVITFAVVLAILVPLLNNQDAKTEPVASNTTLSAGDTVTKDSSFGKYTVTLNSITESTNRNETADEQPGRIILLSYSYENVSCEQTFTFSHLYIHAYDADGNLLEVYPSVDAKWPKQPISTGKKNTASVAYGLNSESDTITVEIYNVFDLTERIATYSLTVGE